MPASHLPQLTQQQTPASVRSQHALRWPKLPRYFAGRMMNKAQAIALLRQNKPSLIARFGVTRLALFGSTARDDRHEASDIDVLVGFDGPATSKIYFGVQFQLEDAFAQPIDLVTEKALRPELREYIEQEAIDV